MINRGLLAAVALLAFACGVLAIGWKSAWDRGDCWQEVAEEGLSASGRRPP